MERTENVFSKIIAFVAAVALVISFTAPIGALAEQAELVDQETTTDTASVTSKTDTAAAPESTPLTTTSTPTLTTTEETEEIENGSDETTDEQGETEESPAPEETEEVESAIIPAAGEDSDQPSEQSSEEPVAVFNGIEYASLKEAVEEAAKNEGGTIALLRDYVVDKWVQDWNSKNLTVEGNNHTLTINELTSNGNGDYLLYSTEGLTVRNLNIILPPNGNGFAMHSGTLSNVSITGGTKGVYAYDSISVDNCTFVGQSDWAVYTNDEGGTPGLIISNSTFVDTGVSIFRSNEQLLNCTIEGSTNHSQLSIVGNGSKVVGNTFSGARYETIELWSVAYEDEPFIYENNFEDASWFCVYSDDITNLSNNYWGGTLPALDHDSCKVAVVSKDETEMVQGNENGQIAIHTYYVTNPVGNSDAILDHDWGIVESTDPTCYDDGYEHLFCQQCDLNKNVVIPATDHDWGEWQVVSEPAIGVQGLAQRVCAHDNAHIEQQMIPALADETTPPSEDDDPQQPGNDDENDIVTPLATTTDDAGDTPDGPTPPAAPTEQLVDDETPLAAPTETIIDDETPLAAFDTPQCWVHILMIIGIIVTLIYGACVIARRTRFTHKLDKLERNTVSQRKAQTTERDTLWVTA